MARSCPECRGELQTRRETYRYDDACGGVPVALVGVDVQQCKACGQRSIDIPNIEGLHRAIAMTIARKRARLTAAEVRFLRKYLGYSSFDFGKAMGVDKATVSRWESAKNPFPMGPQAERLLRVLVFTRQPVKEYPQLEEFGVEKPQAALLGFRMKDREWEPSTLRTGATGGHA